MLKFQKEIEAYAKGEKIEAHYVGWSEWVDLKKLRDQALRVFLDIEQDDMWSFRVGKQGEDSIE